MKYRGIELLEKLCSLFGPSGWEDEVSDFILGQIEGDCDSVTKDRNGNIIAKINGRGIEYDPKTPKKLMICAHMDEVGMMISDITDEGLLSFANIGGISTCVLLDKRITVQTISGEKIHGIISSKAIHSQTPEERKKHPPVNKIYIDIGAGSREEAQKYVEVGTPCVFDSDFVRFGTEDKLIKAKALDDRIGCFVMIELMRDIFTNGKGLEYDVYFAFTCCEEIGISGAVVAANSISPDYAIVLESTAVADIHGVPESSRVATVGEGGAISMMDKKTIYDRSLIEIALNVAEVKGIKAQMKRYVSGANDSANIQRSGSGVKVLSLSAPSRYIHSASNVACVDDIASIKALVYEIVAGGKF